MGQDGIMDCMADSIRLIRQTLCKSVRSRLRIRVHEMECLAAAMGPNHRHAGARSRDDAADEVGHAGTKSHPHGRSAEGYSSSRRG